MGADVARELLEEVTHLVADQGVGHVRRVDHWVGLGDPNPARLVVDDRDQVFVLTERLALVGGCLPESR
jgi:hypothetical protein